MEAGKECGKECGKENDTDGSSFVYWPQNVLVFDTASPATVTYRNNVLNVTGDDAQLTNQSITGAGTVNSVVNDGVEQTYYGNYNSNYTYTYTLPQTWILYMNETVQTGKGMLLQMGVQALNGPTPDKITWFDSILIHDPNVASAAFVVDEKNYTSAGVQSAIGSYFDSELVFGGGAGGNAATFQVNAELALFYQGNSTLEPYPSLYSFGDDTAEAAYNIDVSYSDERVALLRDTDQRFQRVPAGANIAVRDGEPEHPGHQLHHCGRDSRSDSDHRPRCGHEEKVRQADSARGTADGRATGRRVLSQLRDAARCERAVLS